MTSSRLTLRVYKIFLRIINLTTFGGKRGQEPLFFFLKKVTQLDRLTKGKKRKRS